MRHHHVVAGMLLALLITAPGGAQFREPRCVTDPVVSFGALRQLGGLLELRPAERQGPVPRVGADEQPGAVELLHPQYPDDFNDGPGRQKAAPDNIQLVESDSDIDSRPCGLFVPEVYTEEDVYMLVLELDWDGDDHVAHLEYGDISVQITCHSSTWCSGTSSWHTQHATNPAGVTAEARIKYEAKFTTSY